MVIREPQLTLIDEPRAIGYGDSSFRVQEIDRNKANKIIVENHYSKKYFNNSTIHLGVFINDNFVGVLQYGHLLNNLSAQSIVKSTLSGEFLELNRMWLDDKAPRNSESKAISYSIKYIKNRFKGKIKWIQSFADERCGGFGIVYQACSFKYYGEHNSIFYTDGDKFYHNIQVTASREKAGTQVKDKTKLKKITLRQFRYIKFMKAKYEKYCLLEEKPYPKHYEELA